MEARIGDGQPAPVFSATTAAKQGFLLSRRMATVTFYSRISLSGERERGGGGVLMISANDLVFGPEWYVGRSPAQEAFHEDDIRRCYNNDRNHPCEDTSNLCCHGFNVLTSMVTQVTAQSAGATTIILHIPKHRRGLPISA